MQLDNLKGKVSLVGRGGIGREVNSALRQMELISELFHSKNEVAAEKLMAKNSQIVIDASLGDAFLKNLDSYLKAKQKVVVIATGWYDDLEKVKAKVYESGGVMLWSANYSLWVWNFLDIISLAAKRLSPLGKVSISYIEKHHVYKVDSPAGTGKVLAKILLDNSKNKTEVIWGQTDGALKENQIHAVSLRGGENTIYHEVHIENGSDKVVLSHDALNRGGYIDGVLQAVEFVSKAEPGVYNMDDLIKFVIN